MGKQWLPHLNEEMLVGARNNNLCSYVIALEGWRRGLELKFYSRKVKKNKFHVPGCLFSLSNGSETHMFYKSRGMRVKGEAFSIGDNKIKAKQKLKENNLPVPEGKIFKAEALDEEIVEFAKTLEYPVVLKPAKAAQGKGVISNIENEEQLIKSLKYVRQNLEYKSVILEEHAFGKECRFYVMNNEVLAVLHRIPANVVGNGKNSISELIKMKNSERKKNPRLYSCLIKVDFEIKENLAKLNLNLKSIPKEGEIVYLRTKSNISSGGDSEDLTDEIPPYIKQVAVQALKAIPNFPNGGVDMIIDFTKPQNESVKIIELTPVPQIGSLVFPMYGKARDIPSKIIDFYFPETINKERINDNVYFDLKKVLAPLNDKMVEESTVIPCPKDLHVQKELIIDGKVQGVGFRRWLRKRAIEHDLSGFVQNIENNKVKVRVAGLEENIEKIKKICEVGPKRASVLNINEEVWVGPVKVGFEIKKNKPNIKAKNIQKHNRQEKLTLKHKVKKIISIIKS